MSTVSQSHPDVTLKGAIGQTEAAAAVRERPILFSAPMVRALLNGRKTQTRRKVKGVALSWLDDAGLTPEFVADPDNGLCPYGAPGDLLWVREAWTKVPATAYRMSEGVQQTVNPSDPHDAAIYAAGWDRSIPKWRPSIHMPRWASRIALRITDVRVERLQEISEADALAEGIAKTQDPEYQLAPTFGVGSDEHVSAVTAYADLWEHINGVGSWDANPWVWAVSFERFLSSETPAEVCEQREQSASTQDEQP